MDTTEETQSQEPQGNKVVQFFSHPVVGISGSIASIIGVALAILFYIGAQEKRDLVYTISPVRTVLAQAGITDRLKILFLDEIITGTDVIAIQLTIWNRGKASIHPQNILSPVEIKATVQSNSQPIPVSILEVSSNKISRELTDFKASDDREYLRQGRIPLTWKILEKNDGSILQIIYAGPLKANINVIGSIEGQKTIRYLEYYENKYLFNQYSIIGAIFSILSVSMVIISSIYKNKSGGTYEKLDIFMLLVSITALFLTIVLMTLDIMKNLDLPPSMIK